MRTLTLALIKPLTLAGHLPHFLAQQRRFPLRTARELPRLVSCIFRRACCLSLLLCLQLETFEFAHCSVALAFCRFECLAHLRKIASKELCAALELQQFRLQVSLLHLEFVDEVVARAGRSILFVRACSLKLATEDEGLLH
jgi:hypothetical protein